MENFIFCIFHVRIVVYFQYLMVILLIIKLEIAITTSNKKGVLMLNL